MEGPGHGTSRGPRPTVVGWASRLVVLLGPCRRVGQGRASKKPGARSGPRLVVFPEGGVAACGQLEMGTDLPLAPFGLGATHRGRSVFVIIRAASSSRRCARDMRAERESRPGPGGVSTWTDDDVRDATDDVDGPEWPEPRRLGRSTYPDGRQPLISRGRQRWPRAPAASRDRDGAKPWPLGDSEFGPPIPSARDAWIGYRWLRAIDEDQKARRTMGLGPVAEQPPEDRYGRSRPDSWQNVRPETAMSQI
jgi:hypothetical protein